MIRNNNFLLLCRWKVVYHIHRICFFFIKFFNKFLIIKDIFFQKEKNLVVTSPLRALAAPPPQLSGQKNGYKFLKYSVH